MLPGKIFVYFAQVLMLVGTAGLPALADDRASEAQKKLNEQVLTKPFYVPNDAIQNKSLKDSTEQTKPSRSKSRDSYYRYWYNGYYYPYPYSYYGFPRFWYK